MKKTFYLLLVVLTTSFQVKGQKPILTPENNPADKSLIKEETYEMAWYMLMDSSKIEIGKVRTEVQKKKKGIYIISTVEMPNTPTTWVDSTIVGRRKFEPIYHSSFNQQRDMVLNFSDPVTGYYNDKQSGEKTEISELVNAPYFDSNFYPQFIRWLPLKTGYKGSIAIFDYNPKSGTGVLSATIKNTEQSSLELKGAIKEVWKVTVTDDISHNTAISTYYIERESRKVLKQEIDLGGRKMVMELVD
ncbi:hypothetical protein [Allomuricauda sp. NBRC 101325]|uniref:DUF3108 domain-containing protein n=1 Tax=Allomuricauda sp. NBRC 101325 TaxID=1113758 RepID=UPI0024A3A093|nr:hypothetical protein [Muricauda sp. NBRC 101325]GLU45366.1 hypothetical protein Musp01_29900 [Muricauda sp. NBRC 101325]